MDRKLITKYYETTGIIKPFPYIEDDNQPPRLVLKDFEELDRAIILQTDWKGTYDCEVQEFIKEEEMPMKLRDKNEIKQEADIIFNGVIYLASYYPEHDYISIIRKTAVLNIWQRFIKKLKKVIKVLNEDF